MRGLKERFPSHVMMALLQIFVGIGAMLTTRHMAVRVLSYLLIAMGVFTWQSGAAKLREEKENEELRKKKKRKRKK